MKRSGSKDNDEITNSSKRSIINQWINKNNVIIVSATLITAAVLAVFTNSLVKNINFFIIILFSIIGSYFFFTRALRVIFKERRKNPSERNLFGFNIFLLAFFLLASSAIIVNAWKKEMRDYSRFVERNYIPNYFLVNAEQKESKECLAAALMIYSNAEERMRNSSFEKLSGIPALFITDRHSISSLEKGYTEIIENELKKEYSPEILSDLTKEEFSLGLDSSETKNLTDITISIAQDSSGRKRINLKESNGMVRGITAVCNIKFSQEREENLVFLFEPSFVIKIDGLTRISTKQNLLLLTPPKYVTLSATLKNFVLPGSKSDIVFEGNLFFNPFKDSGYTTSLSGKKTAIIHYNLDLLSVKSETSKIPAQSISIKDFSLENISALQEEIRYEYYVFLQSRYPIHNKENQSEKLSSLPVSTLLKKLLNNNIIQEKLFEEALNLDDPFNAAAYNWLKTGQPYSVDLSRNNYKEKPSKMKKDIIKRLREAADIIRM